VVGSPATVELACAIVAAGGKVVMVGLDGGVVPVSLGDALPPGVTAVVPLAGSIDNLRDVIALAANGQIEAHSTRYPLSAAPGVLELVGAGRVSGRAVLVPSLDAG